MRFDVHSGSRERTHLTYGEVAGLAEKACRDEKCAHVAVASQERSGLRRGVIVAVIEGERDFATSSGVFANIGHELFDADDRTAAVAQETELIVELLRRHG